MNRKQTSAKTSTKLLLTVAYMVLSTVIAAQNSSEVIGAWEGESICTVRPSPCHDEHVIYEISSGPPPAQLSISMDKVVNGERENMGTLPYKYEAHTLTCTQPGTWKFVAQGKQMTGTLKLPDGTLYRRIKASRKH